MSDSDPLNEMTYWRKQVIQLHCLMNQLRLPHNRAVIYLLNIVASPRSSVCREKKEIIDLNEFFCFIKEWKDIDKILTDSINEARDHYKFLMIISKHIGSIYRNDPVN